MNKYIVHLRTYAYTSVEVEADDPDQAIEKSWEAETPRLCAQCSGWDQDYNLELGDEWETSGVTGPDGTYYDVKAATS